MEEPVDLHVHTHTQVHQRSDDVKRSLDLLYLLNEGGDIHNMLEENIIDFKQFQVSLSFLVDGGGGGGGGGGGVWAREVSPNLI